MSDDDDDAAEPHWWLALGSSVADVEPMLQLMRTWPQNTDELNSNVSSPLCDAVEMLMFDVEVYPLSRR